MTLVMLDGPDYRLRRRDALLVASPDRDENFSASARWARSFARELAGVERPSIGVGASLSALAAASRPAGAP